MKRKSAVRCCAALGALFAGPVVAQDDPSDMNEEAAQSAEANDDTIVVTARRVEENLQDIPLAVTAFSGSSLRNQAVRDIRDLSGVAPNLVISQGNADAGTAVITIRGQSQTNITPAVDPAVGLYVDNVNNPRSYGLRSSLVDIARVEILRGPQGTLYGRNTTGGAVSIFTNDPGPELAGIARASIGNYEAYGMMGVLNVPLTPEAGLRFVAQHNERAPWGEAPNAPQGFNSVQFENSEYYRAKFKGAFGPVTVAATVDHYNLKTGSFIGGFTGLVQVAPPGGSLPLGLTNNPIAVSDGPPIQVAGGAATLAAAREIFGLVPGPGGAIPLPSTAQLLAARDTLQGFIDNRPFYTNLSGAPLQSNNDGIGVAFNIDVDLSPSTTLRSISGYRTAHRFSASDNFGVPFTLSLPETTTNVEFFSQELQMLGTSDSIDWVLGAYYSYEDSSEIAFGRNLFASSYTIGVRNSPEIISKSIAGFGQITWRFAEYLELTLGARWTEETKSALIIPYDENANPRSPSFGERRPSITGAAAAFFGCDPAPAICSALLKDKYSDPSWLASLSYKISSEIMVYGKATRGFKGGGQNNRTVGSAVESFADYAPEIVTEFEIGFKSELADILTLNVAGFYDIYSDVQRQKLTFVNNTIVGGIQNAAKARLWGIEGEAIARLSPWFRIEGSFGYLNAKYKDFSEQLRVNVGGVPTIVTRDRSGEDWPAPNFGGRLGVRANQPTHAGLASLSVDLIYQSEQNLVPQSIQRADVTQPGYSIANARLALEIDEWDSEISLFGRNLFEQEYYTSGIGLESLGGNVLIAGEPRIFGLEFTKRLGGE